MTKKVKVLISVLVAVVLLVVGGAATVMAHDGEPILAPEATTKGRLAIGVGPQIEFSKSFGFAGDNMTAGLLTRVAEILGIPQEDLANAFKQARQEMREEALIRWLDKIVEKGRITQDEADEIKVWYEQRPEVLGSGLLQRVFAFPRLRGRMWGGHRGWHSDNTTQTG